MMVNIREFKQQLSAQELLAYENITSTSPKKAQKNARLILEKGWSHSNYPHVLPQQPIPWEKSFETSRSWSYFLHCWDLLNDLIVAYQYERDASYLAASLKVALEWCEKYSHFGVQSHFAWYDMAVGLRAYRLGYLIDAAIRCTLLSNDELEVLFNSLELHRRYLAMDKNISFHSNHGFYQVAGQLAMTRRYSFMPEMEKGWYQATERMIRMLGQQFSDENVHLEHSPDYHRMVGETLKGIVQAGLLQDKNILEKIEKIEETLSWFIKPNGYLVNFGDTDRRLLSRSPDDASKWSAPAMQYVTSGGVIGHLSEETHKVFRDSGYFIVRDNTSGKDSAYDKSSYLAQILAFHSRTHKHADDLSFVWTEHGRDILVDAGRYGYLGKTEPLSALSRQGFWYSDPNRIYVESTHAHNTVEIDGQPYPRRGVKPYGSALERWGYSNGLYYSEGHVRVFKSIRFYRTLIFLPGEWLVVFDWLWDNNKQLHDFRQWFHFDQGIIVNKNNNGWTAIVDDQTTLTIQSLLKGPQASEIYCGDTTYSEHDQTEKEILRLQGWFSPKEREIIPNAAAAYEDLKKPATVFATLFSFGKEVKPDLMRSSVAGSGRKATFAWAEDGILNKLYVERPQEGNMTVILEK